MRGRYRAAENYPQQLERWAAFIEKQKSPLKSEPHSLAQNVWSGVDGIKFYLGGTDAYKDFAERIAKAREELEKWAKYYAERDYTPPAGRGNQDTPSRRPSRCRETATMSRLVTISTFDARK